MADAHPTLDQLQVFLAVAELGSFSAAARKLNRAQSVISYTIANLEAQLQLRLFERKGARQPRLTEAGRAMVIDARRIVAGIDTLRARARSMRAGVEAQIALAISVMVPSEALVATLRAFRDAYPEVTLNLTVGELGMVVDLVRSGKADIGISGSLLTTDERVIAERIGHSFMVPVAAADHPLASLGRKLVLTDVREEVQIVVTDTSGITRGRDFNVLSFRTWRVGDITTKHRLIRAGLGWGGLPVALVRDDLQSGALVALDLDAYETSRYPLYALRPAGHGPGPAARWLLDMFREQLASCSVHLAPLPAPDRAPGTAETS